MGKKTVILSLVIHAGLAIGLLGAAQQRVARRAVSVSMAEDKKKAKPTPKKPPPPPKVIPRPTATPRAAAVAKSAPVATPTAVSKGPPPVATAIQMSNDDSPGGIALPPRAATAGVKVASLEPEGRKRRLRDSVPGGVPDACNEEPSKPEPVFKTEIEYTASARAEGIEGKLKLRLTVGANGSVTGVEVQSSVSPELDAAAVAAAKLWRFKPSMACGKAVGGGTYILARRFELGD